LESQVALTCSELSKVYRTLAAKLTTTRQTAQLDNQPISCVKSPALLMKEIANSPGG
jgi:hypothetical protein